MFFIRLFVCGVLYVALFVDMCRVISMNDYVDGIALSHPEVCLISLSKSLGLLQMVYYLLLAFIEYTISIN